MPLPAQQRYTPAIQRAVRIGDIKQYLPIDPPAQPFAAGFQHHLMCAVHLPIEFRFREYRFPIQHSDQARPPVITDQQRIITPHPLHSDRNSSRPQQV